MFTTQFDDFVYEGDTISCNVDGFDITARIVRDDCSDAPDQRDDGFWPSQDQKSAGWVGDKTDEQFDKEVARAKAIMHAWQNDEWFYCGVVLTVSRAGIVLDDHAAATWGIECNYPKNPDEKRPGMPGSFPNYYLAEVANELLPEALRAGRAAVDKIKAA